MKTHRIVFLGVALVLGLACRHHTLTPTIGGRPAQTLKAEAQKVEGAWVVTMPMPLGQWIPEAQGEDQPMIVLTVEGRACVRWKVSAERWANSERPFFFQLRGVEEQKIEMSVTYTLFTAGTQNVLKILAHGWIPIPFPQ